MQQPLDIQQIRHQQRRVSALLATARHDHAPPLVRKRGCKRRAVKKIYDGETRKTKAPTGLSLVIEDQYPDVGDIAETSVRNRYTQKNYKKYLDKLNIAQLRHSYDESVVQSIRQGKMEVATLQNQLVSRSLGSMDKEVQLVANRRASIVKSQLSLSSSSMSTGRAPTISERTIYIPSGQDEEDPEYDTPLVRYQHGDIGAGKDLNVKLTDEEFEEWKRKHGGLDSFDNTPVATPGERRVWGQGVQRDSDSRRGRGLGSRGAGSRGRARGLGGIDEAADLAERERERERAELDEMQKNMLLYNRHGMTDSAMAQYKLKELERQRQAARRKRGNSQVPPESGFTGSNAGEDEDEWEKEERRRREEEKEYAKYATRHSKMEMHRQAYIKALSNARMRKLPREPWELATKTTRAYTFSYINHRPACRCEKCLQRKPREKKEKGIPGMKLIFGEINMYDFYPRKKRKNAPKSPPPWVRERALQHSLSLMGIRRELDRKKQEDEVDNELQRLGMGIRNDQVIPPINKGSKVQEVKDNANHGGLVTKSFMASQLPGNKVQKTDTTSQASQSKLLAYNTPVSRTNSISSSLNVKRQPLPELTKGRYVSLSTEIEP
ncbi:uncharacterized protein LOC118410182 isoform X1 [Branchiostoma floridae]|uniref:Uncharacterized protein LOC118410182 isoform X1 n=1 Tax=Branchiostoma floridae TaxID=7739 RepID=C3YPY2_BRAFL|nr:uncharacterized protein LOC118410182 isoform X1 [Branchiostoma floridae]XP_035667614.1 uncharacterized protein LOC118410182 isoform X1 [Branchiostoma floridae]|eukprot:XP_002601608.1 hypothetical protein BRAFLDRAFT_124338 [Branchiostoma floridae]